jgi:Flp pilus assembly protein TadG
MISTRAILADESGATAVEFALTAPIFIALLFGIIECGLALWTQFGLQYGTEAAARCASIDTTTCSSASAIASYAAGNALGLTVPASTFTATTPSCGNLVQASYVYTFLTSYFGKPRVTLTAQSCFPPQTQ